MEIIEKLPDDIVLYIYTKFVKRYRFCKGELIKLIDLDKYSFLEKYICRKIVFFYQRYSGVNETKYCLQYSIPNVSEVSDRKNLYIDNDMICLELTESLNSLYYEVSIYRLKHVEHLNHEKIPTIYHKGGLSDYDWEIVSYSYNI
jgi:hypothetical protein